jgi:hypothetical protein
MVFDDSRYRGRAESSLLWCGQPCVEDQHHGQLLVAEHARIIVETDVGQTRGHTTITDNGHGIERYRAPYQASPKWLLILLSATTLPTALSVVMLGPLLVALAHAFQTSVAVSGQLAAATAIT